MNIIERKMRKLLVILITLCMTFGMMSVCVFAEDTATVQKIYTKIVDDEPTGFSFTNDGNHPDLFAKYINNGTYTTSSDDAGLMLLVNNAQITVGHDNNNYYESPDVRLAGDSSYTNRGLVMYSSSSRFQACSTSSIDDLIGIYNSDTYVGNDDLKKLYDYEVKADASYGAEGCILSNLDAYNFTVDAGAKVSVVEELDDNNDTVGGSKIFVQNNIIINGEVFLEGMDDQKSYNNRDNYNSLELNGGTSEESKTSLTIGNNGLLTTSGNARVIIGSYGDIINDSTATKIDDNVSLTDNDPKTLIYLDEEGTDNDRWDYYVDEVNYTIDLSNLYDSNTNSYVVKINNTDITITPPNSTITNHCITVSGEDKFTLSGFDDQTMSLKVTSDTLDNFEVYLHYNSDSQSVFLNDKLGNDDYPTSGKLKLNIVAVNNQGNPEEDQKNIIELENELTNGTYALEHGTVKLEIKRDNVTNPATSVANDNNAYHYKVEMNKTDTLVVTLTPNSDYYGTLSLSDINVNQSLTIDENQALDHGVYTGIKTYTFRGDDLFENTNHDHLELNAYFYKELNNTDDVQQWYTISYDNSENVRTENGTVKAVSIEVGDKTYTTVESDVNNVNVFYIENTIGKTSNIKSENSLRMSNYGIAVNNNDGEIFINSAMIEDVSIHFELTPDFGYQLTDIKTNESNSLLDEFTPVSKVSSYTFDVIPYRTVHFGVDYVKTNNTVSGNASSNVKVTSTNAATSGTLNMNVDSTSTNVDIIPNGSTSVASYDITLSNIVSKGGDRGSWNTTLIDLGTNSATVTLPLNIDDAYSYSVIREHEGESATEIISTVSDNTISFNTNKFSTYTIVKKKKVSSIKSDSNLDSSSKTTIPALTTSVLSNTGDTVVADNGSTVTLLKTDTVSVKVKNITKSSVSIPSTITVNGKIYNVTTLKGDAFNGTVVKKVTLPSTITKINDKAFAGDKKLSSIKINSKKLTLGKNVFKGISKKQKNKIKVTVSTKMSKKNFYSLRKALMKQGLRYSNIKRK